jgi:integrase
VKRPTFDLLTAIEWYVADYEVEPTTMQSYRSHLTRFAVWLGATKRPVTLSSVEPETVEAYLRTAKNQHTKMNKCIALKSFARYLARKQIWYAGTKEQRTSVLEDVQQPKPSPTGMPGYSDDELRGMLRAVDRGPNRLRNKAVIAVELHGFRSKEVRLMLKRNVVMAKANEIQGEFIIDSEARTKKGTGGVRNVPMEPFAKDAILAYVRIERPDYRGTPDDEPLFLTDTGAAYSPNGWHAMAQRLRHWCAEERIPFKQHRLRPTRTRQLHEAGWEDSAIMEALGWKSVAMLRRYLGKISVTRLKRYPMTLNRVFGPAA